MQIGVLFEVEPATGPEQMRQGTTEQKVRGLAEDKASEVAQRHREDNCLVIGADTVVVQGDKILGKPKDEQEAYEMLSALQGKEHSVFTGVCLIRMNEGSEAWRTCFAEETKVKVHSMSSEQIWDYINSGDCMDKAGAYGIQGMFAAYVEGIRGDYNNVVGLPVAALYHKALEYGIEMRRDKDA